MGPKPSAFKRPVVNNNASNTDIYDTSWIEAFEKSLIFVWCDGSIGTETHIDDAKNTIIQLASVVNKNRQLVHTFNEASACEEFIKHVNNVCLITSGAIGQDLVPLIHNLEQVHLIYIFCINREKHLLWAKNYEKVQGVHIDINEICASLKSYINLRLSIEYDRVEFDVINPINNLPAASNVQNGSPDTLSLIYSKLTKLILLNMNSSDSGLKDMVNYCRHEHKNDYQVQLINDFEKNYSQFNPTCWYTRNYFFQGILNRALRAYDLYALCSMHRFIKDLNSQLSQLNESQRTTNEPLYLYCGQFLPLNDFNKIKSNIGGIMCINQFLSANPEQGISLMYIKQQNTTMSSSTDVPVIFQIYIDRKAQPNVSYAHIGPVSQFVHEKDYLISIFSVYRIDKVEKFNSAPSTWTIRVTLIGKNDSQYNSLTQEISNEKLSKIDLSEAGFTILDRLRLFKQTNRLFRRGLQDKREALRTLILQYNMAMIYYALGEYDKALNTFQATILIARAQIALCLERDDICLAPIYSNMSIVFQRQKQFGHAIEHAFRALRIAGSIDNDSILKKEFESSCYYSLAVIHDIDNKISDARNFYEQALRIRQEYLPLGHPDITNLQRLITLVAAKRTESC